MILSWIFNSFFLWLALPVHVLTLTTLPDAQLIFHQRILPNDTFQTVYIHSLELTPVWEYFTIGDQYEIVLTDTLYESTGAGLPIPIDGQDRFIKEGNQFHIYDINRPLPDILLRVHPDYNNRFFFNNTLQTDLSHLVGHGVVRITTRQECLGHYLRQELSHKNTLLR